MSGDSSSLEPADGTAARILIVDDDASVRDVIGVLLRRRGTTAARVQRRGGAGAVRETTPASSSAT